MDPNIFAVLRPAKWNSIQAFTANYNRHLSFSSRKDHDGRDSSTATPIHIYGGDDDENDEVDENGLLHGGDCLLLHFRGDKDLLDMAKGWQFGYSTRTADVVVCERNTATISRKHFFMTITPEFRVQLTHESKYPTIVHYCYTSGKRRRGVETTDKQDVKVKKGDSVIIALAPEEDQPWSTVEVSLGNSTEGVEFTIEFPNHNPEGATEVYLENMRRWLERAAEIPDGAHLGVGELGLDSSVTTTGPSQLETPVAASRNLYYQREIGRGRYGKVDVCVDLMTGEMTAIKELFERPRAYIHFKHEVSNLQRYPHKHIVDILGFTEEPQMTITMTYHHHGSIDKHRLLPTQYRSAFRQVLEALRHLHGYNVAHRDLKPENILVADLQPLHIEVGDFGWSKEAAPGEMLTTVCGSPMYWAPEILLNRELSGRLNDDTLGYWMPVDIWSAGVIMYEWTYGCPDTKRLTNLDPNGRRWIRIWSDILVEAVRERDQRNQNHGVLDPVLDLVKHMLVMKPERRFNAHACLQHSAGNGLFRRASTGEFLDPEDTELPPGDGATSLSPERSFTPPEVPPNTLEMEVAEPLARPASPVAPVMATTPSPAGHSSIHIIPEDLPTGVERPSTPPETPSNKRAKTSSSSSSSALGRSVPNTNYRFQLRSGKRARMMKAEQSQDAYIVSEGSGPVHSESVERSSALTKASMGGSYTDW